MQSYALISLLIASTMALAEPAPQADPNTYLAEFTKLAQVDWPANRTLRIVCHGHSVPSGYFKTPEVRTMDAYPMLMHIGLCERFPHAVINVAVTAIGGENAEQGAARFDADVLAQRPDLITIDYSLNDRGMSLERARAAWVSMIERALSQGIRVILLTPTPDISVDFCNPSDPFQQHAAQIRQLARDYGTGIVDSTAAFEKFVSEGSDIQTAMSQFNHPNRRGHELVAAALLKWFPQ